MFQIVDAVVVHTRDARVAVAHIDGRKLDPRCGREGCGANLLAENAQ